MKASSKRTLPRRQVLPVQGGAIGWLASKVRLRAKLVESSGLPEGSTRAGLDDERTLSDDARRTLVTWIVDSVFTAPYLESTGFSESEAIEHNGLLKSAVGLLVADWAQLAASRNRTAVPQDQELLDWMWALSGDSTQLVCIAAAYDILYGQRHPMRETLPVLVRGPGLSAWWKQADGRAGGRMKASECRGSGTLDRKTVQAAVDGESLPRDSVLRDFATAVSALNVPRRNEDGHMTAAEIEFELRVICAASEMMSEGGALVGTVSRSFQVARTALQDLPADSLKDLLRVGRASRGFEVGATATRARAAAMMGGLRALVEQISEGAFAIFEAGDLAGLAAQAELHRLQAERYRCMPDPDGDGPSARRAEYQEALSNLLRSMSEGRTDVEQLLPRHGLLDEIAADNLCIRADLSPVTRETVSREELLREALVKWPRSSHAHGLLADELKRKGRIIEAIHHYETALSINPGGLSKRVSLARLLAALERYQEVLALADNQPSHCTLDAVRVWSLVHVGNVTEAARVVGDMDRLFKGHPHTLIAKAIVRRATGRREPARRLERMARNLLGIKPLKETAFRRRRKNDS